MGSIYSIADLIDMVRRRIVVIVGVAVLGTVLSAVYALSHQHLYTSSEVLQVQTATIADDLAPSTVAGSSARRLQLIEQRLMARSAVLELIDQLDLFADQPAMKDSDKVGVIRESVTISGVAAAREGYSDDGAVALLRITADWPTAQGAQQLAHEFAKRTIDLSISSRLKQAQETLAFFELQEQSLQEEMSLLEDEVTAYRSSHNVALPGSIESARREIETLREAILAIDRQMITLQSNIAQYADTRVEQRQREQDQQTLSSLVAQRALLSENMAELTQSLQGTPEAQIKLAQLTGKIEDLREQLQSITARRKAANVSLQLETQRQSERLTVPEPAPLPDYPSTRARKQIVLLGAFASALIGLGIAFLLDLRHPVIRTGAQMERELGLRPVITIPEIDQRRRKRKPPPAPKRL